MSAADEAREPEYRVEEFGGHATVVANKSGRSILGTMNKTPVFANRKVAQRVLEMLNEASELPECPQGIHGRFERTRSFGRESSDFETHDRRVSAEAWDECLDAIEQHELNTEQARAGNPYRAAAEQTEAE